MKKLFRSSFYILVGFLFFWSCTKPQTVSDIPEVKFKSISITDSIDLENPGNSRKIIKLTITVIDGDGDIGILGDNNYIYPGFELLNNRDLYIKLFEKVDGEFVEVPVISENNFGMPYLQPTGQDKTLKADLEVSMDIYKAFYTFDTIKYNFYLYDRKKHISNTAETPEIPADTLGLIE